MFVTSYSVTSCKYILGSSRDNRSARTHASGKPPSPMGPPRRLSQGISGKPPEPHGTSQAFIQGPRGWRGGWREVSGWGAGGGSSRWWARDDMALAGAGRCPGGLPRAGGEVRVPSAQSLALIFLRCPPSPMGPPSPKATTQIRPLRLPYIKHIGLHVHTQLVKKLMYAEAIPRTQLFGVICMFVVVNFDALAQASDIQIERRQVVFLRLRQDLNPGSQTLNRQTECQLTNQLSYRGQWPAPLLVNQVGPPAQW